MFSRYLAAPFAILALIFLYLTWEVDPSYSLYIIAPVIVTVLILVFAPQLDWWWYQRRPPQLPIPLQQMLDRFLPFFQHLSKEQKKRFIDRVALFNIGVEYMPQGMEEVPEDIKVMLAAQAVQLTFNQESMLLGRYERLVIYPHPFPTPQYQKHWHTSETFAEDAVFLFSIEQVAKGFLNQQAFFQIGTYEFAKAYLEQYPVDRALEVQAEDWNRLELIFGQNKDRITAWVGLPLETFDPTAVLISLFFSNPEAVRQHWPEKAELLEELFAPRAILTTTS